MLLVALVALLCVPVPPAESASRSWTVTGTLEVGHGDDLRNGRSIPFASLQLSPTRHIELAFRGKKARAFIARAQRDPKRFSGRKVKLRGIRKGSRMKVRRARTLGGAKISRGSPLLAGPRKVAVIQIKFGSSDPWSTEYTRSHVFSDNDSVNSYVKEITRGRTWLTGKVRTGDGDGDVFGWYTVPRQDPKNPGQACPAGYWADNALAQSGATGYDHYVFMFPQDLGSCPWAGQAIQPGQRMWGNGSDLGFDTLRHEVGHNFGIDHASGLRCKDSSGASVALSSNCEWREYEDPYDAMGGKSGGICYCRHYSNVNKEGLRLLSGTTETPRANGTYTLEPSEPGPTGTQVLRIPRTTLASGRPRDFFYLEYRQPYGHFDDFSSSSFATNGVTIRISDPVDGSRNPVNNDGAGTGDTLLIDTVPGGAFTDAPLAPGRTFTDPQSGVSVTTLSTSASGAQVALSGVPPAVVEEARISGSVLEVEADDGYANRVSISKSGGNYVVTDSNLPANTTLAGAGCTVSNPRTAVCPAAGIDRIEVRSHDGDDSLAVVGDVAPWFDGGTGTDVIDYSQITGRIDAFMPSENVWVDGNKTVVAAIENLTGSAHDDTLVGNGANNKLAGGDGFDTIIGGGGSDSIDGGGDLDTASYDSSASSVTVSLATGQTAGDAAGDTLTSIENLTGSNHNDNLTGNDLANRLDGGGGQDTLSGRGQADTLLGMQGNDTLTGGSGPDVIQGGDEPDDLARYSDHAEGVTLSADGNANDGNALDDDRATQQIEYDNISSDVENLEGGPGPDGLTASDTANDLDGAGGTDMASWATADGPVTVLLYSQTMTRKARGDTLSSIENVTGSNYNDTITGDAGTNFLIGGAGDDTLKGREATDVLLGLTGNDTLGGEDGADLIFDEIWGFGGGNDNIYGGDQDDILDGGKGGDRYFGQGGVDTVSFTSRVAPVKVVAGGSASDDGEAGEGDRITDDVESVFGGAGNDSLTGNNSSNLLIGGPGADKLYGLDGNDTLTSRDGISDSTIDCGAGTTDRLIADSAAIDLSSRTVGCEISDRSATP